MGSSQALRYFGVFVPGHCHVKPETPDQPATVTSWLDKPKALRYQASNMAWLHAAHQPENKNKLQMPGNLRGAPHGRTIGILEALRIGQLVTGTRIILTRLTLSKLA